jgi:uncharacterized protein (TIGR01244 family)
MPMTPTPLAIAPDVCVTGQLDPASMSEVARLGFRAVVNNRPDYEGGYDQPTNQQIEEAAKAAGLLYRFLPVSGVYQSPEDAEQMARLLRELPRPLLMFCRSGARSTRLYMLAQQL